MIRVESVRVDRMNPYPTQSGSGVKLLSAQPEVAVSGNDITVSGLVAPGQYFQQAIESIQGYPVDIPDKGGAMALRDMLGDFAVLVNEVANLARRLYEDGVGKVWLEPAAAEVFAEMPGQIGVAAAAAAEVQATMSIVHEEQIRAIEEGDPRKEAWDIGPNRQ